MRSETPARAAVTVVALIAGLIVAPTAPASAGSADAEGRWFGTEVARDDASSGDLAPGLVRLRSVEFDADSAVRAIVGPESLALADFGRRTVAPERDRLSLTLFDGRILPFEVSEVAMTLQAESPAGLPMVEVIGGRTVNGEVVAAGSFTFIANSAGKYEMSGGIDRGDEGLRVEIRQTPGRSVARLAEVEHTSQPDEGDTDFALEPAAPDAGSGDALAAITPGVVPVVDLVVGYASSLGDHAVAEIGRRVSEANDALARSRANVRLALVSVIPVAYTQHSSDMAQDLYMLRSGLRGLDALQNRRAELGADLVALIVPNATPEACGYGHVPYAQGDRRFGDSVTAFSCLSGHTFAHELGHNLGGNHDRENAGSIDFPFAFSYGHRVSGVVRTVMAYNCPVHCPRALQFSNPNVPFVGYPSIPSGTATADNARSISLMGPVIAAYRDGTPVSRIAGADRFQTAAAISMHGYSDPGKVDTVLLATGLEFPDALSAAPLAAKLGAPLLLTMPGELPAATSTEIARLKPSKIIVVGGPNVVADSVLTALRKTVPASAGVQRIWGADRYETSLAVVRHGWSTTDTAFLATGTGFADALSAGAAAGVRDAPVILVPGDWGTVHAPVAAYLATTKAKNVYLAGGTGVLSPGIEADLKAKKYTVTRYGGSDRFSTSTMIARAHHTVGGKLYLATAHNFPDALAGAAVAGKNKAPLILSAQGCVLKGIQDVRLTIRPNSIVLLGGVNGLSEAVETGAVCT